MAYIPDEAFDDMGEVGQKAFLLYSYYCKHGSMSKNCVTVSIERGGKFVNVVYENACRLNAILKKKGWIKIDKGETILLKGFSELTKTSVKTDENVSLVIPKVEETDENNSLEDEKLTKTTVLEFPQNTKTDENVSPKLMKTSVAYKEEPASSNQPKEKEKKRTVELRPTDSPELSDFRKNLSDFQDAYAKPTTKQMAIANKNAIRKLFELADGNPEVCKAVHESLQAEEFRKGRVDWTTVVKNFNFYLANKSQPTEQNQPKGYDATKDIMSPDYIMPKSETSFEDVIWICYDIHKSLPTFENFEITKADYLRLYPNKQAEVEKYEHSELFRQRFSESGQTEFNAALAANGRGHSKTQNQMPVPS